MLFNTCFELRLSPCLRYVGAPSEDGSVCARASSWPQGAGTIRGGLQCLQKSYDGTDTLSTFPTCLRLSMRVPYRKFGRVLLYLLYLV